MTMIILVYLLPEGRLVWLVSTLELLPWVRKIILIITIITIINIIIIITIIIIIIIITIIIAIITCWSSIGKLKAGLDDADADDGEPEHVDSYHLESTNMTMTAMMMTMIIILILMMMSVGMHRGAKLNLFLERRWAAALRLGPVQGSSSHQDFPRFSRHKCSGFHRFQLPSQHTFLDFWFCSENSLFARQTFLDRFFPSHGFLDRFFPPHGVPGRFPPSQSFLGRFSPSQCFPGRFSPSRHCPSSLSKLPSAGFPGISWTRCGPPAHARRA